MWIKKEVICLWTIGLEKKKYWNQRLTWKEKFSTFKKTFSSKKKRKRKILLFPAHVFAGEKTMKGEPFCGRKRVRVRWRCGGGGGVEWRNAAEMFEKMTS